MIESLINDDSIIKAYFKDSRMNNTIQIDVRDLPCPEPVLKAKKALLGINEHTLKLHNYEIIGNSPSSKENLMRFLNTEGFELDRKSTRLNSSHWS